MKLSARTGRALLLLGIAAVLVAACLQAQAQAPEKTEIKILEQVYRKCSQTLTFKSDFEMLVHDLTFMREYFPPEAGVMNLKLRGAIEYGAGNQFTLTFRYPGAGDVQFFSSTGYDLSFLSPPTPSPNASAPLPSPGGVYNNHPLTLLFPWPLRRIFPNAERELQGDELYYGRDCYVMKVKSADQGEMTLWIDKGDFTINRIMYEDPKDRRKLEAAYLRFTRLDNGMPMFTRCEVKSQGRDFFSADFFGQQATSKAATEPEPGTGTGQGPTTTVKFTPPATGQPDKVQLLSRPLWVLVILLALALSYYLFRYLRFMISRPMFSKDIIVIEEENSKLSLLLRSLGYKVVPFGPDTLSDERNFLGKKPGKSLPKAVIVAKNAFGEVKNFFFLIKAYMEEGGRVLVLPHSPQSALNMPFNPYFTPHNPESSTVFTVKGPSIWKRISPEELQEATAHLSSRQFYVMVNEKRLDLELIAAADKSSGAKATVLGVLKEGKGDYILCQLNVDRLYKLGSPEALQTVEMRIFLDILDYLQGREKEQPRALEENITESINLYRRLLEIDGKNIEAHHHLAELYAKQGNREKVLEEKFFLANHYAKSTKFEKALSLLDDILQIREDHEGALTLTIEIHLRQKLIDKALKEAHTLCETFLLAERYDEALSLYQGVVEHLPESLEVHQTLLRIYERQGNREKALDEKLVIGEHFIKAGDMERGRKFLDDVLKARPDDPKGRMLKLQVHIASDSRDEALEEAKSLRESLVKVENYQSILDIYVRLRENDPSDSDVSRKIIEAYEKLGERDKMAEEQMRLAGVLEEKGVLDESASVLREVLESDAGNLDARMRLVDVELRRDSVEKALAEAQHLCDAWLKEEKLDEALALYRKLGEKAPDRVDIRERIIEILEKSGNREKLLDEKLALATHFEKQQDLEKSTAVLEEVRTSWPDLKATRMRLFDLYVRRELLEKAKEEAAFLADFYVSQKLFDRAVELFEKIRGKAPDDLDVRERIVTIYEKSGNKEKLLDEKLSLASLVEKSGDMEKTTKMVEDLHVQWQSDKTVKMRLITLHIQQSHVERAVEVADSLCEILISEEKYDEAISLYRIILNISPDNMDARQRILQLYHLKGDEENIVEELLYLARHFMKTGEQEKSFMILEKILTEKRGHFEARVSLIDLYLRQEKMDKALEEVKTIASIFLDGKGYNDVIEIQKRLVTLASDNLEWRDALFQFLLLDRESG